MASSLALSVPALTTPTATAIGTSTATLGATVTADGGAALTERGTVWGTTAAPTGNALAEGGAAVSAFSHARSGFAVNTLYTYRGYAINSVGTGYSPDGTFWTLANTPNAPTVGSPTTTTLNVAVGGGDGNPVTTQYAIQETGSGNYVQAGGSLGGSAVWQTAATWGTKTVTGLTPSTLYTFAEKARNGANAETGFGSSANGTTATPASGKIVVTLPGQTFASGSGNSGTVTDQTAGTPFNITLTATLADGVTTDTTYSGTKTISYSGPSAANGAPVYTTSVGFDNGQSTNVVATTLKKAETTTITATDGSLSGLASSSLLVNPGAIASYTVTAGSPQTAGTAFNVTVTARDANANTVTSDSSTVVTMTGSPGVQFDSNGDSTFGDNTKPLSSGMFVISAKDNVAHSITITATDPNSKTGVSSSITINAGPIDHYAIVASSPQRPGAVFLVTVSAQDAFNNGVNDSSTVITMASASGNVQFDANANGTFGDNQEALSSGLSTFNAKNDITETTTITVSDANGKTGTSGSIIFATPKFRSRQSGDWNDFNTWQVDTTGGGFVDSPLQTPNSADDTIEIRNTHTVTVTAAVSVDQVTVDTGGQITINSGVTLTIVNGAGTDLVINGTVVDSGTFTISSSTWSVGAGGTFVYNTTTGISSALGGATLDAASTFIYRGTSALLPTPSVSGRTYGNLVFESTSGNYAVPTPSGGSALTINGSLSIGTTGAGTVSYNMTGFTGAIPVAGDLSVGSGSSLTIGASAVTLNGNLANSGTVSLNSAGTGSFTFNGNTTISGSSTTVFANGFTINATKTVTLAQNISISSGKTGTVNGTLAGTGAITGSGSVTVSSGGFLSPGTSLGTLTFASVPTLSGTISMEINKSGGPTLRTRSCCPVERLPTVARLR